MWSFFQRGHLPAIKLENETISYKALSSLIDAKARTLSSVFLGARVAFVADSSLDSILNFFALLKIKASPLLLSTRLPKELIPLRIKEARASFFLENQVLTTLEKHPPLPPFILLFTSGSTGKPKLACLSPGNFLEGAKGSLPFLNLQEGISSWLLSVPLFHVSGLSILFRALVSGASITFDKKKTTHASIVPTHLLRMLRGDLALPNLSFLLLGGAPIGEDLLKKSPFPIRTTYGLTEMASQVTMTTESSPLGLGEILPARELSLSSSGEILVKGKTLFSGYDEKESLVLPIDKEGWFATGDLGKVSSGVLYYKGRKDNLFISGGENIYPEEIEKALLSLPGVLLAVALPKEDKEFGKRPIAFVHMDKALPSQKTFEELLSPLLPRHSIPIKHCPFPQDQVNKFKIKRSDFNCN
jgi:o-succinylbenzoate---CoA ligase